MDLTRDELYEVIEGLRWRVASLYGQLRRCKTTEIRHRTIQEDLKHARAALKKALNEKACY